MHACMHTYINTSIHLSTHACLRIHTCMHEAEAIQASRTQERETWPMRIMYESSAISFFTS